MLRSLQSCVISFDVKFVPRSVKKLWGGPCLKTILSKNTWVMIAVSIEGKAAVSIYFVKRSPTIRIYRFPKFMTGRGPIQSAASTFHSPETAIGRRDGLEWWTSLFFWAQETQDLTQRCKSAKMFQKYVDLGRSYVLFKPRWPLVKWWWHQCKSSVCRVFAITNWITVLIPACNCLYRMSLSLGKYRPFCRMIFSAVGASLGKTPSFKYLIRGWSLSSQFWSLW